MRYPLLLLVLAVMAASGVFGFGANLPRTHLVTVTAEFARPVEDVWEALTDYETIPEWSSEIVKVERLADREGKPVWKFYDHRGNTLHVQVIISEPRTRHASRILEASLPLRGSRTMEFVETKEGSRVTLVEEGTVDSPFWRFVYHFVIGEDATLRTLLQDAGRRIKAPPVLRTL